MKKLTAVILCFVMLFSMAACTQETPQTPPAEDPGKSLYTQASHALNSRSDISLELVITTLITVAGDEFSEQSTQTLTYQGKGTDEAMILMDETMQYSVHSSENDENTDEDTDPPHFVEIWYRDTIYTETNETYYYQCAMDAEDAARRYTPVALFDTGLYGSITSEQAETGTTIRFTAPSAGEAWAVPQDSELVEANGTALVNAENVLTEMSYTVTYTYGSALVKKTVQSKPLDTPKAVTAPSKPEDYTVISNIDALRTSISSFSRLFQADSLVIQNSESLTSEAAALVRTHSIQANVHGRKKDTLAKISNSVYLMDYTSGQDQRYEQEETFQNGKLTTTTNNGLPSTSSVAWENVRAYIAGLLAESMLTLDYWEDITVTDLGSLYLMEYRLNDSFGNTTQNSICETLWEDPSFLLNLSSDYKNAELNGYLSIDKYTGIPVATGYYYKGIHTIEGRDYALTLQYDQIIESPALGAYQKITNKLPTEEEPENKATPLFYHVTGSEGQEMWLFGTIHVGDARTAYLPEAIRNAFETSDALAIECNAEAFEKQVEEDTALAEKISNLYFNADGSETVKASLNEEDYAYALKLLKATGNYNANMSYAKPYLWSNAIETFYLRQGYSLHGDQGVEKRLLGWAEELDKDILEIESSMAQLQTVTSFSTDLQMLMLEDIMDTNGKEYWTKVIDLYELWCTGNEADLREKSSKTWDTEDYTEEEIAKNQPLFDEYNKAMSLDRNEDMLDAAISYLESDKVIFYAVGLAHLLDSTNGLVDALQNAGYSVELVSFAN